MRPITHTALALALAAPSTALAAHPGLDLAEKLRLEVDGQVRPRVFAHSGRDFVDGASPAYVTQRAQLGLTMSHADGVAVTVRVRDVRIWGEEADTLNDFTAEGLDLHEAFARLTLFEPLDLCIGRQELSLDEERLVGAVAWSQRGRSFDGVRAIFTIDKLELDAAWAKERETDDEPDGTVPRGRTGDVDFGYLQVRYNLGELGKVHVAYLGRVEDQGVKRHTLGAWTKLTPAAGLALTAEGWYQTGSVPAGSLSAFMAAVRAEYTLDSKLKPAVTLWGELLSGDGTPTGAFDTYYGTNHKWYGEMDLFLVLPAHTANLGLIDAGGRLAALAWPGRVKVNLDVHAFLPMEAAADGSQFFGLETNLVAVVTLHEWVKLRALYGLFLPGDSMRAPKRYAPTVELGLEQLFFLTTDVSF